MLHREVAPLPSQLLDHSTICLEEQLYSQGFALQTRCIEAGFENNVPARVPPPSHLAFASTITVHPKLTTRTRKKDRHIAANDALKHLKQVISTLDAQEGGLKDAFHFQSNRTEDQRSKRARTRRSDIANSSDDELEKPGFIRSLYYEKSSLWTRGEDFWAIVGWAFNCSVLYKARWERWKPWLEQMLDLLQKDMDKFIEVKANEEVIVKESEEVIMKESLLSRYISTVGESRNNRRRIMRAITADGTKKMVAEFGEIWKNETRPPKKQKDEHPFKRRKLDIDNDQFGDYGDPDSEDDTSEGKKRTSGSLNTGTSRSRRSKQAMKEEEAEEDEMEEDDIDMEGHVSTLTGAESFGGMDSIRLRRRLLALLTLFSQAAPKKFMDIEELFSLFTEFLRPLPLPVFQQFVLPLQPPHSMKMHVVLLEMLFQPLLGTTKTTAWVSQVDLETKFAPQAAITTTATDNAKVSLLVESLLRALWKSNALSGDMASLRANIEKGIKARGDKVAYDGRKKVGKNQILDEQAKSSLQCSAERMLVLLDVIASPRASS